MPPIVPPPPVIGSGLPAYTLPPTGSAGLPPTTYGKPAATPNSSPPENIDMTQPVHNGPPTPQSSWGAPTTPVDPVPGGVPQQRGQGTVYSTGGYPAIDMTMPVSDPLENSGSLTGHILAQGWYDAPVEQRRSNLKVVVAMLAVLGLLVTMSLVFVFTAGDAFTDMINNLTN
ncbi:hypothetical protein OHA21_40560 [Actinoplanes sp. NBC_00393]|uniref:hypothetical protein n=1 Tax=Actinoplanes sp. NBC_00393 TaxID=2975953 RepID=UPI002E1F0D21